MNKERIAKLCEIAFIFGQLEMKGEVKSPNSNYDLNDMYKQVYEPIMTEWENGAGAGVGNGIFLSAEEEGYISAYAQRVILERYK